MDYCKAARNAPNTGNRLIDKVAERICHGRFSSLFLLENDSDHQ